MNANHWLKHPHQRHQYTPTEESDSSVPGRQRSLCWACPGQSSSVVCDSSASDPAALYSRVHWCPPPGPHPPHPNGFWTGGWSSKCLEVIQWWCSNRGEEMKKGNFKKGKLLYHPHKRLTLVRLPGVGELESRPPTSLPCPIGRYLECLSCLLDHPVA